jgi:hypothetical protein
LQLKPSKLLPVSIAARLTPEAGSGGYFASGWRLVNPFFKVCFAALGPLDLQSRKGDPQAKPLPLPPWQVKGRAT